MVRGSERPDTGAPGVTSVERQSPPSSPTNADSLTWRVTFDENVKDVDAADFAVSGTSATLAVSEVTASTVYDVTASGGDLAALNATVTLSFAAGQNIEDLAGNALTDTAPSGTNEPDYVVDNAAPTVTSVARQSPPSSPTNADSLTWRVTFGENVTGVDAADFMPSSGTTATLAVSEVTASTVYDVTASGGDLASLDATATLSFAAGQDIADLAGNALAATAPTGTDEPDYAVDNTAPALSSASVNGTSLVLTFGEDLAAASGLANTAFTVKRTPQGGSEGTVSLSGSPSVSGATVTLTLAAALAATDTDVKVSYAKPGSGTDNRLADAAGNEVAGFTDQAVSTDQRRADGVGLGGDRDGEHGPCLRRGPLRLRGRERRHAGEREGHVAAGRGPRLSSCSTARRSPRPATPPRRWSRRRSWTADELVYRPVAGQFGNDLASFTFRVNDGTEDSADAYTMTVDVDPASGHEVLVSNTSLASGGASAVGNASGKQRTQGFTAGDHAAGYALHSVGIELTRNDFSSSETLTLSVYSSNEDGTANALVHRLTTPWSSGPDIPADGIVYFTAPDGATLDAGTGYHLVIQGSGNSGNDALASYAGGNDQTGGTGWTIEDALRVDGVLDSSGDSYRMVVRGSERPDTGAPGVVSILRQDPSSSPTNADSLTWRMTFDENVKDVDAADFAVSGTSATLAVSEVTASTVYDVTASGGDLAALNATVTLSFAAGQDIEDLAGNALADTAPSGTNEPDYVVDNAAPTVASIERQSPPSSPTNADSLTWRVTFGENVTGVDAADFAVGGTTATLAVSEVTASTVYDVTASGGDLASLDATATLSFAANQDVADLAGNALADTAPSGTDEPGYAVDNTAPALSSASVNGTSLVLTFGEDLAAASGLANTAFTVKRTPQGGSEGTVSLSGSPSVSGATVTLTLAAAIAATDTDVKVSYAKPGSGTDNRLVDAAGNEVADFTDQAVSTANAAPTASDSEVTATESRDHAFDAGDFGYADANGDTLASVKVTSLPGAGLGSARARRHAGRLGQRLLPAGGHEGAAGRGRARVPPGGRAVRERPGVLHVQGERRHGGQRRRIHDDRRRRRRPGPRGPGEQPGADGLDELLPGGERLGQDRHAGLRRRGPCRRLRPALGRDRPGPERLRHRLGDTDAVSVLVEQRRHGERAAAHAGHALVLGPGHPRGQDRLLHGAGRRDAGRRHRLPPRRPRLGQRLGGRECRADAGERAERRGRLDHRGCVPPERHA